MLVIELDVGLFLMYRHTVLTDLLMIAARVRILVIVVFLILCISILLINRYITFIFAWLTMHLIFPLSLLVTILFVVNIVLL